jgi:P-type E1-E2 ATPase
VIRLDIPGWKPIELVHVVLDVNGTLARRGKLLDDVAMRIDELKKHVDVRLASADTFGSLSNIAAELGLEAQIAPDAACKLELIETLGLARTAHVGNGSNDAAALRSAALGLAVLGPEGLSSAALAAADVVCASVHDALDLLLDGQLLSATLRG